MISTYYNILLSFGLICEGEGQEQSVYKVELWKV